MAAAPTWYYQAETGVVGPISSAELKRLIDQGVVRATTRIRRGEAGAWFPAEGIEAVLVPSGAKEKAQAAGGDPAEWYVSVANKRKLGPLTRSAVATMLKQGKLQPTDPVWKAGMAQWRPASEVPGLIQDEVVRPSAADPPPNEMPPPVAMEPTPLPPGPVGAASPVSMGPPGGIASGWTPGPGRMIVDQRILIAGIAAGAVLLGLISGVAWALLRARGLGRPADASGDREPPVLARSDPALPPIPSLPRSRRGESPAKTRNTESFYDDAIVAMRRGQPRVAKRFLNQYLSGADGDRSDEARALVREIDLALSVEEAREKARGLDDEQLRSRMREGFGPMAASAIRTPEVRPIYERTLREAFQREASERKRLQRKPGASLAGSPGRFPRAGGAPAPLPGSESPAGGMPTKKEFARTPEPAAAWTGEPARDAGPAPAVSPGDAALDKILASPAKFAGQTRVVDGFYKVGTRLTQLKGADGRPVGWSLPVSRNDGVTICTGEAKVAGRDVYLILEDGLAPFLEHVFRRIGMRPTIKAENKCILTVRVPAPAATSGRPPVVEITALEILGSCDLMNIINNKYDKAFTTVQIARDKAFVGHGNGSTWVERLGGEEKYVLPLRRKYQDLMRRVRNAQTEAVVSRFLQAELGRVMAISATAQARQAQAVSSFFGRQITP